MRLASVVRSSKNKSELERYKEVKELTYKKLKSNGIALPKKGLKADVLDSLSPHSSRGKKRLDGAWRKVEREVRRDERVRVMEGDEMNIGEVGETWKWVYKVDEDDEEEEEKGKKKGGKLTKAVIG